MSYPLGSITNEPFIVDGRNVLYSDNWTKGSANMEAMRQLSMQRKMDEQKIYSLDIRDEAIEIWKRGKGKQSMTMTMALYIVCRYKGIPFDLSKLTKMNKRRFVFKANNMAQELGVHFPRINNDKLVLDLCDKLNARQSYLKMKEIYPKARLYHSGNPKATMGAILYWLIKPTNYKLTQNYIAMELGMAEFTIREACAKVKEIIPQ